MAAIKRRLRVVELYAGTGRSVEPYRDHRDFEIALLADINERARDAYLANHDGAPYSIMDLSTATPAQIAAAAGGDVDILLGCPPCQGFSESGLRNAKDDRNDHITRFADAIVTLKPLAFAMENVPLAAVSQHFADFQIAVRAAGYEMTAAIMNAAEYGSVQSRQRLVVIGRRGVGSGLEVALPAPTHSPVGDYFDYAMRAMRTFSGRDDGLLGITSSSRRANATLKTMFYDEIGPRAPTPRLGEVLEGLPAIGTIEATALDHVAFGHGQSILAEMGSIAEGGQRDTGKRYYGAAYARLHRDGLAKTLTRYFSNAGSGRFWHPTQNRSLTVREAARIQGFDDSFLFGGGALERNSWMIGNALDRALADASFRAMRRMI